MIVISAPLQGDKIIELLENQEGQLTFTQRKGMKLFFETIIEDKAVAARTAYKIIKKAPWGTGLFFQADAVV